jgi:hypothetical protein
MAIGMSGELGIVLECHSLHGLDGGCKNHWGIMIPVVHAFLSFLCCRCRTAA